MAKENSSIEEVLSDLRHSMIKNSRERTDNLINKYKRRSRSLILYSLPVGTLNLFGAYANKDEALILFLLLSGAIVVFSVAALTYYGQKRHTYALNKIHLAFVKDIS